MRMLKPAMLVLFVIATLAACGGPATEQPAEQPAEQAAVETTAEPLPMVEVTPEGVEFEPPVAVEQIPDGAWFCDMGTVHYARAEQGDGTCAVCGMELVQKVAAAEPMEEPAEGEVAEEASTDEHA